MTSEALAPGSVFQDRYEIVSKVGEGGFGVVYKARLLTTGQLVALKTMTLPTSAADPRLAKRAARFLRESQLCARLYHPNIVQVMDTGRTDESLFTVFAFAPGEDLARVLSTEGALQPSEVRHLMAQVLDALACAHGHGVVHRDLKPSNIMITATGGRRNALVLDFGIGAFLGTPGETPTTPLTVSTDALGTPGYGAPEQWRGGEITPRADLFSWGLVFLECLTGRMAYPGLVTADIIYRQLGPDPVPVPAVLEKHPLGELLRRATEKDPAARSSSAAELLRLLDGCDVKDLTSAMILGSQPLPLGALGGTETTTLSDRRAATASPSTPAGERRQVTALCCRIDVVSARGAATETEELDEILSDSLRLCTETAVAHKGRLVTILGDELLFYFGLPRAEETDAQRAAHAALAIAKAVATENQRLASRGTRRCVRMGLHTGLVFTTDSFRSEEGAPLVGTTPRTAARLATVAARGTVVVSASSQRILRAEFELGESETGAVDDLAGEAPLYLLKRERPAEPRRTSAGVARAKLVGRTQELQILLERWRRSRSGVGQSSLIIGEPGIGKSRLVSEVLAHIPADSYLFLEARCSPDTQAKALFPIVKLVDQAAGIDPESGHSAQVARLEAQLASCGLDLAQVMPLFLELCSLPIGAPYVAPDVSAKKQLDLTFDAVLAMLCALAERQPLLLLVEDLHWADPTSVELLARLVREAPTARMGVIMTARPEFNPAFSSASVLQLPLNRLESSDVESMVADLLDRVAIAQPAVAEIARRTDGVPLFVEELTTMMRETGVLQAREGRYELTAALSEKTMPTSLRGLLNARLDRLGRARETAQTASALGREFSIEVLLKASSDAREVVEQDLQTLSNAGLCVLGHRHKSTFAAFKHALVRDAAYDSLARSARQEVHGRIATAIEQEFPEIVRTRPDLLAHHHQAAGSTARAIPYAQQAAEQALRHSAYAEALGHATKVAEWARVLAPEQQTPAVLAANTVATQALMATRGWVDPEIKRIAEESFALVQKSGPHDPNRIPMLWSLFSYHHTACHHQAARAVADELAATAESMGDHPSLAAGLTGRGAVLLVDGRTAEARQSFEQVIAVYEQQPQPMQYDRRFGMDSLVLAKGLSAHIRWFQDDPASAFQLATGGIEWARRLGHIPSLGMGLLYGAQIHQHAGDKPTTAALAGEILMLAGKHGLPAYEGYAALFHAWATDREDQVDFILDLLGRLGCNLGLSYYASLIADSLANRGDLDGAIERVGRCLALCAQNDEHYYEPVLHWRLAGYQSLRGLGKDVVRRSLEQASSLAERYGLQRIQRLARASMLQEAGATHYAAADRPADRS